MFSQTRLELLAAVSLTAKSNLGFEHRFRPHMPQIIVFSLSDVVCSPSRPFEWKRKSRKRVIDSAEGLVQYTVL